MAQRSATKIFRRSQLFVPGNETKKVEKSISIKADSIIFDLEDAVPEDQKNKARQLLKELLMTLDWEKHRELCVRVNPVGSPFFEDDVEAFKSIEKISSFVVPKAEQELGTLHKKTGKTIIALIETGRGFMNLEDIVRSEGLGAIAYGAADFASSIGGALEAYYDNLYVKSRLAIAAKSYGVDAIDNVFFNLSDSAGFTRQALFSKSLGYLGKQVIHPTQVELANEIFSCTSEEIERARKIVERYEKAAAQGLGAIRMDDALVDAVHYREAKRILSMQKDASHGVDTKSNHN